MDHYTIPKYFIHKFKTRTEMDVVSVGRERAQKPSRGGNCVGIDIGNTNVQFDKDAIFQGPHHHRDSIGRVTRLCLSLGVTRQAVTHAPNPSFK